MAGKQAAKRTRQPGWLNKKEMSASIGISVQAFDKWGIQPVAKVGREVFYTVDEVIDFCVARELKKNSEPDNLLGKSFDELMNDPELSYTKRADLLKHEKIALEVKRMRLVNAVLEGRSLPADGVTEVLSKVLSHVGEILDGLPLKIRRKHPKLDKRVVELIRTEVIKAQNLAARTTEHIEEIIDAVVAEAEERIR